MISLGSAFRSLLSTNRVFYLRRCHFFVHPLPMSDHQDKTVATEEKTASKRSNEEVGGSSEEAKKPRLDQSSAEESSTNNQQSSSSTDRTKKRKVALLMAYSGQGYYGMQRNPGTRTIEDDLLTAMMKVGLLNEEAYKQPQMVFFQRAARTDKGVSAARQVVSLKIPVEGSVVDMINKELPAQIRVLGLRRVTKNFNSKCNCDARTYSYTIPTLALAPADQDPSEDYRVPAEIMDLTSSTLRLFEGTHNFHNFTARKQAMDPSAKRYIMKFECGAPFISEGMEFAELRVKGQSFMMHQIRKMVGLVLAIVRGLTTADTVNRAWQAQRLDLPVAPGLGLVLEEVHYDKYNRKFGSDGLHESLDWGGTEEAVEAFKKAHIHPAIVEGEKKDKSMVNWLQTLPLHSYDIRVEPHLSETHGLATLGQAVSILEGHKNGLEPNNRQETHDGLSTLVQAARAISEQEKENGSLGSLPGTNPE